MKIRMKVGPNGEVILPKDFMELLNIKPGGEILIEIRSNEIAIRSNLISQDFLKKFIVTPKKLSEKIDFKHIYDKQYERA
jgi:AbrB family looped-hinge helix DNA binding protein